MWRRPDDWCPISIGVNDFMVGRRTKVSLSNLSIFAVRDEMTYGELAEIANNRNRNPGWKEDGVRAILDAYNKTLEGGQTPLFPIPVDWQNPEEIQENLKSGMVTWFSEASPTLRVWHIYVQEENGKWSHGVLPDWRSGQSVVADGTTSDPSGDPYSNVKFLFLKEPEFDSLGEILHIHYADGAQVAPFRYHSVRGLGFLLYGTLWLQNSLRSKFFDHVFESLMWYFRTDGAGDQEQLQRVDLHNMGLIPPGLNIVPANERYSIRTDLAQAGFALNRQTMAENSASFTSDPDLGSGSKELTATEVQARLAAAGQMVRGALGLAIVYEGFRLKEIVRRLLKKASTNKDAKKVRENLIKKGVPEQLLEPDAMVVRPQRAIAMGHPAQSILAAQQLLSIVDRLPERSQKLVYHIYISTVTSNPELANELVPLVQDELPKAARDAQIAMGALMDGLPVTADQMADHATYILAMIGSMSVVLQKMEVTGPNFETLAGIENALDHASEHLQMLARDPNKKQLVAMLSDQLSGIANVARKAMSILQQQNQAQAGQSPSPEQAKLAAEIQAIQTKAAARAQTQIEGAAVKREIQKKDADTRRQIQVDDARARRTVMDIESAGKIEREQEED